jgi:hypothetical protein
MNTSAQTPCCIPCLASFRVALINQGIDPYTLRESLKEGINMSREHFRMIRDSLTPQQQIAYKLKQYQLELLLSLIARIRAKSVL